jgi:hypothetical protein
MKRACLEQFGIAESNRVKTVLIEADRKRRLRRRRCSCGRW